MYAPFLEVHGKSFGKIEEKSLLLYISGNRKILFKAKKIINSGFIEVDKDCYLIVSGDKPLGIDSGNFHVNPSLVYVVALDEPKNIIVLQLEEKGQMVIISEKENSDKANEDIAPERILKSGLLDSFYYLIAKPK